MGDDHNRPFLSPNIVNKECETSLYTFADNNNNFIKFSGMAGEVNGQSLFTSDQWKELERQAMIYKYIKESIPVPPHLLVPSPGDRDLVFNLNFNLATIGKDSEPERCKRTDGKKWRCSRDVAPHQKYCERHLHRGRPRSRKPVEIHNNNSNIVASKKTRFDKKILPSNTKVTPIDTLPYIFHQDVSVSSQREFTRYLDLAMEEQLHHSLGRNLGLGNVPYPNPYVFEHDLFQDSQNLIPFSNYGNDAFQSFANQQSQMENVAWSSDDPQSNESSVFSRGNLSLSSFSLSMGRPDDNDEMGLHIEDTDHDNPQVSSSWMGSSTPGGPLAEVFWGRVIAEV